MRRIACLWVPAMSIAAHVRLEPELADVPLALVEGAGSRITVAATSERAHRAGIVVGMRVSHARALCDSLVVRPISSDAITVATETLVEVAQTVGPRVESDRDDRVFLDCCGTRALWASESTLASILAARAVRCGLPAWVGIAESKLAASVAARESGGVCIVPLGQMQEFLASRPISLLDPDPATASTLASWGIRSIGDLVALPAGAVAHRLGAAGSRLVRRARGEDDAPLAIRSMPCTFEERLELEYAVDRIEPLVFVFRRLLESVTTRLDLHGLGCREIAVDFNFDGGGQELRKIAVAAPTTDLKTLLTLVRTHLEARPPSRAVTKLAVAAAASRILPTQLDLLEPAGPAPAALAAVLARLAALCGPDRVGVLRAVDTHRPEAVKVEPFIAEASIRRRDALPATAETSALVVRLALRAFRPPVPLEVFESRKFLDYVRGHGFGGRVVHWAGPWRVRGEWWTTDPYAREYYDVELSDGAVYRIYRDARSGRWTADGVYD